jgi:hypothetical protein
VRAPGARRAALALRLPGAQAGRQRVGAAGIPVRRRCWHAPATHAVQIPRLSGPSFQRAGPAERRLRAPIARATFALAAIMQPQPQGRDAAN